MPSEDRGRPYSAGQLRVIMALADGGVHTLREIADRAHLSISGVQFIIENLRKKKVVQRVPPRYELMTNWKAIVQPQELQR